MSINLYLGCMFSGKTSELNREYKRWTTIGKLVLYINYAADNRYGSDDYVYSHSLEKIKCIKVNKLSDIADDVIKKHDIIMVNEGQFFPDLVSSCVAWAERSGKHVIVCGLDGDSKRKPIGQINDLLPLCDNIIKLKALCKMCKDGTAGIFSWRLSEEDTQVVIDNNYIPVCRKHFVELTKEREGNHT